MCTSLSYVKQSRMEQYEMNNLQARAARIAEEAKANKPRYVSGTEPVKPIQTEHRPIANGQRKRDAGQSVLDELKNSF